MKARAILFGPFVGELCWEFFRFAPHVIYLKRRDPGLRIIVLTRESRFDLYGQYADILIPLRIKDEESMGRDGYKLLGYEEEYYNTIVKYFRTKFRKRFQILGHIYPDIRLWRYKTKWQLPRSQMDYDFKPREENIGIAKIALGAHTGIVDTMGTNARTDNDDFIDSDDLLSRINGLVKENSTSLGVFIECVKNVDYVVGNVKSDMSHLALLLRTPLIHIAKPVKNDYIKLLNPLNTPVITAMNIEEGVNLYEDNF